MESNDSKLSASQNYRPAFFALGCIYLDIDIETAINYLSLASNVNQVESQIMLGDIYYTDKYGKRNIDKSIIYYTLAAKRNSPIAQFKLGFIFYLCPYIPHDNNRAIYYFILAAEQKVSMSMQW